MSTAASPHASLPPLPPVLARASQGLELLDPMDAPALRWGIIGASGIARTFSRDIPPYTRSTVVAIGARDGERAQTFADEWGIPRAYGSYEELVGDPDVDAVYVSTIHPMHAEHAMLALDAGKPVLVEKAVTVNAGQARELFALAGERGLFAMEAMWSRHLPHYHLLRQLVSNGALGTVVAVEADHGQSLRHIRRLVDKDMGGGAMLDLGVYPVSFVHDIIGAPESVSAVGRLMDGDVDAGDVVTMRTPQALGVARCSLEGRSSTSAEVTFEHGVVTMPWQFYRPGIVRLRTYPADGPIHGVIEEWDSSLPGGFQYQVAEAARCIAAGLTQSPHLTWEDSIEVMEIMDAARAEVGVKYEGE